MHTRSVVIYITTLGGSLLSIIVCGLLRDSPSMSTVFQEPHQVVKKHVPYLQMFSEKFQLDIVAIDVLGELILTPPVNRYLLFITVRYTKLVKTIPMNTYSPLEAARHLVHEW